MGRSGQTYRLPKLSDEERAEAEKDRQLLCRDRPERPKGWPVPHSDAWERGFDELEEALRLPWQHGPKAPKASVVPPGRSTVTVRRQAVAAMTRARPKVQTYEAGAKVDAKAKSLAVWRSGIIIEDVGGELIDVQIGSYILGVPRSCVRPPREPHDPQHAIVAAPIVIEPVGEFLPRAKGLPPLSGPVTMRPASARMSGTSRGVMRPQPKDQPRIEDPQYRRFVREHPCISCGGKGTADNPIQASHHGPGIMGSKPHDSRCVPLCRRCHMEGFHATGRLPGFPLLTGDGLDVFLQRHQLRLLEEFWWGARDSGDLAEERLIECLDSPGLGAGDGP